MAAPGTIDLTISFPDPMTGRGIAVNTLTLEVLNVFGTVIDTYTLGDNNIVQEPTLLSGVVYAVYDYSIIDAAKTPGTVLTLRANATVGVQTLPQQTRLVSFRPAVQDEIHGVLVQWSAGTDAMASYDRGTGVEPIFYEVRRVDDRAPGGNFIPSFTPSLYTLAYWSLNGNALDAVNPGAHLTLVNGRYIAEGTQVDPVRFEGNGYAWSASSKLAITAAQDFSLSVLVRLYTIGSTTFLAGKEGALGNKGYGLWAELAGGQYYPAFYIGDGTNQVYTAASTPLTLSRYHHLCLTVDRDGDALLYLDGVKLAGVDVSALSAAVFNQYEFRLGAEDVADPHYMWGDVGHGIVFDGVLTPLDVTALYNDMLGNACETILGRTFSTQFLDTDITDPYEMRHYRWRVYRATHTITNAEPGTDYRFTLLSEYTYQQVRAVSAPLCHVHGRIREPNDVFPSEAYVKFYVHDRDKGQLVHARYLGDDEIIVFPDKSGQFSVYLVQDSVIVCHMPEVHLALRFAVPRVSEIRLEDIDSTVIRLRNNI
jgi:hypothetical protein